MCTGRSSKIQQVAAPPPLSAPQEANPAVDAIVEGERRKARKKSGDNVFAGDNTDLNTSGDALEGLSRIFGSKKKLGGK